MTGSPPLEQREVDLSASLEHAGVKVGEAAILHERAALDIDFGEIARVMREISNKRQIETQRRLDALCLRSVATRFGF